MQYLRKKYGFLINSIPLVSKIHRDGLKLNPSTRLDTRMNIIGFFTKCKGRLIRIFN
jgi:hypothetical protein